LTHDTQALTINGGRKETFVPISPGALLPGRNILAIQVHQKHGETKVSSDIGLDVDLAPYAILPDLLHRSSEGELLQALQHLGHDIPAAELTRWQFAISGDDPAGTQGWQRRAKLQQLLGRWPATLESADHALAELTGSFDPAEIRQFKHMLRLKSAALHNIRGWEEKIGERAAAIPPRNPALSQRQIDLEPYYSESLHSRWGVRTGSTGDGWSRLAETYDPEPGPPFDIRGKIMLNSGIFPPGSPDGIAGKDLNAHYDQDLPLEVDGITIGQKFETLHVLHSLRWGRAERTGEPVAEYILHYEDGTEERLKVRAGIDIFNDWQWTGVIGPNWTPDSSRTAWEWAFTNRRGDPRRLVLTHQNWPNPHPEKTVSHIDLVSTAKRGGPTIYAITVE
ncbi:MAG: hypothetical protein ACR2RV_23385, partial [Verrucomicrobiales bacterium]